MTGPAEPEDAPPVLAPWAGISGQVRIDSLPDGGHVLPLDYGLG